MVIEHINQLPAALRPTLLAIANSKDQNRLAKLAIDSADLNSRMVAVRVLTDQKLLAKVASEANHELVRMAAVRRITGEDQPSLLKLIETTKDALVRSVAIALIKDPALRAKQKGGANDPDTGNIDADTIAAYEKLGATIGVMERDLYGDWVFSKKHSLGTRAIPALQFRDFRAGKLPPVGGAFGLDLTQASMTDAGLKELKDLKNLAALDLGGNTRVTDAGLRELKDLKNLTYLNLTGARVTDAGLKELREALPNCMIRK
jgi:hypothetical protein